MLLESLFTSCLSAYKVTVAVSCFFLKPFSELVYASTQSSIFTFLWMHIRRKTFLPDHRMIRRSKTHYLKESAFWDVKYRMKNIHWGQTKEIIFTELIVLAKAPHTSCSTSPFNSTIQYKITSGSNTAEDFTYILANKWHSWDPCLSQKLVFIPKHHKILMKKHKTILLITSGLSDYQGYGAYQMAYVVMNS